MPARSRAPAQSIPERMSKQVSIITHSGSFHADDVFAVATLLLVLEPKLVEARVFRTRESAAIQEADFVVDVGGVYDPAVSRFDHHQPGGAGTRENGVPYAAFGLVWKRFGSALSGSEETARLVDERLVQPIDYDDSRGMPLAEIVSGVYPYTIDRLVSVFNATFEEEKSGDEAFFRLVGFAKEILRREIAKADALVKTRSSVEEAYRNASDKRLVVLEREYPWYPILSGYPEPLFVVFPDKGTGNWGVSAVRNGERDYTNRKSFPAAWAGKRAAELAAVSGVSDAVFCHNRLFFAVAKSREGAVALANRALKS